MERLKGNTPSPIPNLIEQANKNLNKVNALIADLLDTGLASKGQLHINQKVFNLYQFIKECCDDVHLDDIYTLKIEGDEEVSVLPIR